jgi:hypothetical protein
MTRSKKRLVGSITGLDLLLTNFLTADRFWWDGAWARASAKAQKGMPKPTSQIQTKRVVL